MDRLANLIAIVTVIVSRITLWTTERLSFNHYVVLSGFRWHHFYTGGILALVAFLIPKQYRVLRAVVLGIGAGLIVDEITWPLSFAGATNLQYWSVGAVAGTATGVALLLFDMIGAERTGK